MKFAHRILLFIVLGIIIWFLDALVDYYFYYELSFLQVSLTQVPEQEIYTRLMMILFILSAAIVFQKVFELYCSSKLSLKESEERYRQLCSMTFEGVLLHDNGIVKDVNQALLDIFGYEKHELIGNNYISKLFTIDEQKKVHENVDNINTPYEVNGYHKNGKTISVELQSKDVYFDNQKLRLVGFHDISLRQETKSALARKHAMLMSITSSAKDSIIMIDEEGTIVFLNKAAEVMFGYKENEIIGENLLRTLAHGILKKVHLKAFQEFQKSRKAKSNGNTFRLKAAKKDGTEFPIELSASVVELDGKWNAVGIVRDISERIAIENALKTSEEQFRGLYENATLGLYRSTPNGKILAANPALLNILGYSSIENLSSINVDEEGYRDFGTRSKFKELLENEGIIYGFENSWKKLNGKIVYIRESARVIYSDDGKILYYDGTVEDITQKIEDEEKIKQYTEELKQLNATKDKFFSIIAHDLNNPFVSMMGFSEMLLSDYDNLSDEERKKSIEDIYYSTVKTHKLLKNLLTWSMAQGGKIVVNVRELNFDNVAKEAIEPYSSYAGNKNINIRFSIPQNLFIYSDKYMLQTIIGNITNNAIKFSNKGDTILITAEKKHPNIIVTISDSGVGMKEEVREQLFRIDKHQSNIGTANETGTGLGLILCKEFVEKLNGTIRVDSILGKGSQFIFSIPISP